MQLPQNSLARVCAGVIPARLVVVVVLVVLLLLLSSPVCCACRGDQAKAAVEAGGMTPSSRDMIENADQTDPVVQQFRKADLNNDGRLSQYEVKEMMIRQLGYDADEEYVASLLETFGEFDLDSDGTISLDEFGALFSHLGGMERVEAVAKEKERNVAK